MDYPGSVAEIIEPVTILPAQFYVGTDDSPEKRLMLAVLERAIDDLIAPPKTMYPGTMSRVRAEAQAWFASEDESYVYSFPNICQTLSLNAGAIRRALLRPQAEAA